MIAAAVCLLLAQAPADPEAAPSAPPRAEIDKAFAEETPRLVRITLRDGRVVSGKLLLRDDLQMLVETEAGEPVQIDVEDVRRYEEPLQNRNRSRYLFAQSALLPEAGQVSLIQVEVLATLLEVGISDHFSFQVGAAVPAYFLGSDGMNAYVGVKAGTSFNKWVHLAVELKTLVLGYWGRAEGAGTAVPATVLAAVGVTVGHEDLNLTISAGPPLHFSQLTRAKGQVVGIPLFTVSAFARVHTNVGLLTENWVIPNADPNDPEHRWFVADALAARFFGQRWAVDLGILVMPTQFLVASPVPGILPWLNFTFHFS